MQKAQHTEQRLNHIEQGETEPFLVDWRDIADSIERDGGEVLGTGEIQCPAEN